MWGMLKSMYTLQNKYMVWTPIVMSLEKTKFVKFVTIY
jgi:hypothetical protein